MGNLRFHYFTDHGSIPFGHGLALWFILARRRSRGGGIAGCGRLGCVGGREDTCVTELYRRRPACFCGQDVRVTVCPDRIGGRQDVCVTGLYAPADRELRVALVLLLQLLSSDSWWNVSSKRQGEVYHNNSNENDYTTKFNNSAIMNYTGRRRKCNGGAGPMPGRRGYPGA